ncbi:LysR family regulatory protein [Penicillium longicatenatum]|nr:LysR family regulatory protein [Penicillium longicatenatum]
MDIFSIFGRKRPATIPTDRIIPMRYWDDLGYLRSIAHNFTLRFDDVLDVSKLDSSLHRLMEIGDWGQLGARLRLNDEGRLEYHIPARYDKSRPPFIFTSARYDMSINEHPLGTKLPKCGQDQSVLSPSPAEFAPLILGPDTPVELGDWIYTDLPQMVYHVVVFKDATLLTFSSLHTFVDAIGKSSIFKAWIAVMEGREEDIPPFFSFEHDPTEDLGVDYTGENYSNFGCLVSGISLVLFGIRYMIGTFWYGKTEDHALRIPKKFVEKMREHALLEMATPGTTEKPFVSEGDIVIAWWVRTMVAALKPSAKRAVTLMNVFNVWKLFPERYPAGGAGVVANSFFYSNQSRSSYGTSNQSTSRSHDFDSKKNPFQAAPIVGASDQLFLACSNQHMAKYYELDFSVAVLSVGVPLDNRPHALGRPSFISNIENIRKYPTQNVTRITGKDAAGDWWMIFKSRSGAWPEIHRQLMAIYETDEAS